MSGGQTLIALFLLGMIAGSAWSISMRMRDIARDIQSIRIATVAASERAQ